MTAIDRRSVLSGILPGAVAATLGVAIVPRVANAVPLAVGKTAAANAGHLVEKAQVVIVPRRRRRRRRRWVCWWRRGRRVCGWRWV